jgi:GST-like protein
VPPSYIGGGFGHFYKYAPVRLQYAIDRYTMETKRQLDVLDKHLSNNKYMVGDEVSIADFAIWPWILCCQKFYGAQEFLQLDSYSHLMRWMELIGERPAVKRGMRVNGFGDDAVVNRHSRADFELVIREEKKEGV